MEPTDIIPDIVKQIKSVIEQARHNAVVAVNNELLHSYWQVGNLTCLSRVCRDGIPKTRVKRPR